MLLFPLLATVLDAAKDIDLARRLKNREPQAMADLYNRYGRPAYSLVLRTVRDSAVAEDLVQETFFRVWNRAYQLDPEQGGLGSWVLTIARNRAIDYVRSREGRMARNTSEPDALEHPSLFYHMERELLNSETARRVRTALAALSAEQRNVIELAYYEGLSQTEMAERLNEPLGTVKTRVRAALKVLRGALGEAAVV